MKLVRVQCEMLYVLKDSLINRLASSQTSYGPSPVPLELYILLFFPLEQGIADEILGDTRRLTF